MKLYLINNVHLTKTSRILKLIPLKKREKSDGSGNLTRVKTAMKQVAGLRTKKNSALAHILVNSTWSQTTRLTRYNSRLENYNSP